MSGRLLRIVQFPLTRLVIGSLMVVVAALVTQYVIGRLPLGPDAVVVLVPVGSSLTSLLTYCLYVRWIERRKPSELALKPALREGGGGFLIGALFFGASIGTLTLLGIFRITGTYTPSVMLQPFTYAILAGVVEEILFRGMLFRITEVALGTWPALIFSSAVFGLLHLMNPHASLQGAVAIIFEAGASLAAAFVLTRRLWLPIGIHAGWNFTQGGVFGVAVSGIPAQGYFNGVLSGPVWLAGGSFGVEASAPAIVLCSLAAAGLLLVAMRRGAILPAPRRRAGSLWS